MTASINFECSSIRSGDIVGIIGNSCPFEFNNWMLNSLYLSALRATTPKEKHLREFREALFDKVDSAPQHINIRQFAEEISEFDIDEMGLYGFVEPVESLVAKEKWWDLAIVHVNVYDGLYWEVLSKDPALLNLISQELTRKLSGMKFTGVES